MIHPIVEIYFAKLEKPLQIVLQIVLLVILIRNAALKNNLNIAQIVMLFVEMEFVLPRKPKELVLSIARLIPAGTACVK